MNQFLFLSRPIIAVGAFLLLIILTPLPTRLLAGERPYFITYSHQMEEPGNLEIATRNVTVKPAGGSRFLGLVTELEYGITAWWTTEVYLDAQSTRGDSTLFTGYRWENRFRLLSHEQRRRNRSL